MNCNQIYSVHLEIVGESTQIVHDAVVCIALHNPLDSFVIVVAEVLKHVTCYSIGVYPRSATVVLMLAAPHVSTSVSRFLVENI